MMCIIDGMHDIEIELEKPVQEKSAQFFVLTTGHESGPRCAKMNRQLCRRYTYYKWQMYICQVVGEFPMIDQEGTSLSTNSFICNRDWKSGRDLLCRKPLRSRLCVAGAEVL